MGYITLSLPTPVYPRTSQARCQSQMGPSKVSPLAFYAIQGALVGPPFASSRRKDDRQKEDCILIDGTVRRVPVAKILVRTPYFTGIVMAICMENPICDLIVGNDSGAMDPLFKPGKGFFYRRGRRTIGKDRSRRSRDNRRQPDLNLREPSPVLATVRPKLKLLPCTVKDPVNSVMHTERNMSIFGTGKPRESSLVNETKRTRSQSDSDRGRSVDWRKPRVDVRRWPFGWPSFRTHTHVLDSSTFTCPSYCNLACGHSLFICSSIIHCVAYVH